MEGDLSLNLIPAGHLERGMAIVIRCTVRYGGPEQLDADVRQDPTLTLTLDNEPTLLTGQTYYQSPRDNSNIHTKTLVTFRF